MRNKLFIIISLLLSLNFYGQEMRESFEVISTDKGLSESTVTCIHQDKTGFMWFGTNNGLNKYDGYKFTVYINNPKDTTSISGNYIRCIYEDKNGMIWFGTDQNGLNLYNPFTDQFQCFRYDIDKNRANDNTVYSIIQYAGNSLLLGTNDGVWKFNTEKKSFSRFHIDPLLKANKQINILKIDKKNRLWVGTNNGLLLVNKNGKRKDVFKFDDHDKFSLSDNIIYTIIEDNTGDIIIGTNQGISIYNESSGNFTRYYMQQKDSTAVKNNEIYSIVQDNRGEYWIGTFGGGLIRYSINTGKEIVYETVPGDKNSLSNNHIMSLYVDRSGLLWIGTYGGGVNKFNRIRVSFNNIGRVEGAENTLTSNEVYAIEKSEGYIWIGTDNGISLFNENNGQFTTIQSNGSNNSGLSSNTVYCFLKDKSNNIWVGTSGGGLNKLSKKDLLAGNFRFKKFGSNQKDDLLDEDILSMFQDKNGEIWVGTSAGINVINEKGVILRTFKNDPLDTTTLSYDEVLSIYQDSKGVMWIGTYGGLNKYIPANQSFKRYFHQVNDTISIPNNTIYSILEDNDGLLWIGTDGGGLCYLDKKRESCTSFTTEDGLPDNVIYGIIEDKDKNLWVSTNNGLCKITKNPDGNFSFVVYNNENQLPSSRFNIGAYKKGTDDRLFFGSNKGLILFHPDDIKGNTYIPPVVLTDFQLFFKPVAISKNGETPLSQHISKTKKLVLSHKQNVLFFEFSALNYIRNDKNSYAYMMENFNSSWIYVDPERRNASFTLKPGEYVFRVKASNNDGNWNEEGVSLEIIVYPPFYQTTAFYIIAAVFLIMIIILIIHIRTRTYKRNQKILQQKVEERTNELQVANNSLKSEINERKKVEFELQDRNKQLQITLKDLRNAQAQLVDSEKMASLGQLTAGVAHEINNPINFVSGNIKPLRRDIEDVLSILKRYEDTVEKLLLKSKFEDIEEFKQEIDYGYLLEEINSLLNGIDEGAQRTAEIVKGLRNFSRLDEDELKLADLHVGLESTLLILRNKLKKGIVVKRDYGKLPQLMCYPGQLNQVFMNIINNAIHAMGNGGTLLIRSWVENDKINISFKDSGVGMSKEVLSRIFDPFYTTKDVGKGTGLGLSISFGIIEKHDGKIEVKSEPGKGSEFIVILPVK